MSRVDVMLIRGIFGVTVFNYAADLQLEARSELDVVTIDPLVPVQVGIESTRTPPVFISREPIRTLSTHDLLFFSPQALLLNLSIVLSFRKRSHCPLHSSHNE
jgi:hypothetical protein